VTPLSPAGLRDLLAGQRSIYGAPLPEEAAEIRTLSPAQTLCGLEKKLRWSPEKRIRRLGLTEPRPIAARLAVKKFIYQPYSGVSYEIN